MLSLLVGLGNPGARYRKTRHNAGFWLLDALAARARADWRREKKFFAECCTVFLGANKLYLCKPQTFMNASGRSVAAFCRFYDIAPEALLVAHDDMDFREGVVKLKKDGGHGGHNGLRDIISALGSRDFYRLRLGIDHPGERRDVLEYVLDAPGKAGRAQLEAAVTRGVRAIEIMCGEGAEKAMHWLHGGADRTGGENGR